MDTFGTGAKQGNNQNAYIIYRLFLVFNSSTIEYLFGFFVAYLNKDCILLDIIFKKNLKNITNIETRKILIE